MMQRKRFASLVLIFLLTPLLLAGASIPISWETTAEAWKGKTGTILTLFLPPGGSSAPIDGMGSYSWDSSIDSAAVDMGLITYHEGGEVVIQILEGPEYIKGNTFQDSYEGWKTLFVFLDAEGNIVQPDLEGVLFLDIPEEDVWVPSKESPTHLTIRNETDKTFHTVWVYTSDMFAVDVHTTNRLHTPPLSPGEIQHIQFSDHPDLEEAVLYRYGQQFRVEAFGTDNQVYRRTWAPDFDTRTIRLEKTEAAGERPTSLTINNTTGYSIVDIFILTPEMENSLDFSTDVLLPYSLEDGQTYTLEIGNWPYLSEYLAHNSNAELLIVAFDEDDYLLARSWDVEQDGSCIDLGLADYIE